MANKVVYVSVPASIANNFDKMQAITKDILGRSGCDKCHSGLNIKYLFEKEEIIKIDARLKSTPVKF